MNECDICSSNDDVKKVVIKITNNNIYFTLMCYACRVTTPHYDNIDIVP